MRTLVLNASYEPIDVVSWERAITLVLMEKAETISSYVTRIRSVSKSFLAPKIIRLKRYIRFIRDIRKTPYSRNNVFKRDQYKCQYCSIQLTSKSATIDHVIPQSKGGRGTWENTVCCCQDCNRRKGNKSVEKAGMTLIKKPQQPCGLTYLTNQVGEIDLVSVMTQLSH